MASGETVKYALPYPLGTDPPNVPGDVAALANAIDAILVAYVPDNTLAARPAAGKQGRRYTESAASAGLPGVTWRDDGAAWRALGSRVSPVSAADIGQIVRGFAGQTADLTSWQNSAGSSVAHMTPAGELFAGAVYASGGYLGARLSSQAQAATDIVSIFRGISAQSGNLTEWRDSGNNTVAKVGPTGVITATNGGASQSRISLTDDSNGFANSAANRLAIYARYGVEVRAPLNGGIPTPNTGATTDPVLSVIGSAAANTVLLAKAAASQTGDVQQWQDASAVVLAKMSSAGTFGANFGYFGPTPGSPTISGVLNAFSTAITSTPLVARGIAGQSQNLQAWQDSTGAVLAALKSDGTLSINNGGGTDGSRLFVVGAVAGNPVTSIRGASGQTGDLTSWQDSAGAVKATIAAAGYAMFPAGVFGGSGAVTTGPRNMFTVNGSTEVAVGVREAASQTGDVQQWQNSIGVVKARMVPGGLFSANGGYFGPLPQSNAFPSTLNVYSPTTATIPMAVRGASGQTANLQEWQNSTPTTVAKVDAAGNFTGSGLTSNAGLASGGVVQIKSGGASAGSIAGYGYVYVDSSGNLIYITPAGTSRTVAAGP
jgi:hypothetical protein